MDRKELIKELEKQKGFKSGYQAELIKEAISHLKGENLFRNVGNEGVVKSKGVEFSCGFDTCRCGKRIEKKAL